MAEFRKGSALGGERLPWLEPVEDEELPEDGAGIGRAILVGLLVLAVIAMAIGGVAWMRRLHAQHADIGTIIKAPTTPYKTRPTDPGGMPIASTGAVAERTGIGGDINGVLDPSAIPEQPVVQPGSAPAPTASAPIAAPPRVAPAAQPPVAATTAPVPAHATPLVVVRPAPKPVVEDRPAAPSATGGGTIQLGALSSQAKAKAAWKALAARFDYLKDMTMAITPVTVGDATLYRLRASGGGPAGALCTRLKLAGETCSVVAPGQ